MKYNLIKGIEVIRQLVGKINKYYNFILYININLDELKVEM